MKTAENNPQDWFFLAGERLLAADTLYKNLGATYSGVELLQEAVERYLKGYLISHGWTLRKVHDLTVLIDEASKINPSMSKYSFLCESLTEQFWTQHYPGGDLSDVGEDFPALRELAEQMINQIRETTRL